jgi:hypothetical protein
MSTPHGKITVERHVYQPNGGGKTYCPADRQAGLVGKSTPRLAKLLTSDYCEGAAGGVVAAFQEHHQVQVSKDLVRDVSLRISDHVKEIEDRWTYALPERVSCEKVCSVSVSRDGAMVHLLDGKASEAERKAGYREAMCGVISLYDGQGELLHAIYQGVGPQKRKTAFTHLLDREVDRLKSQLTRLGCDPVYVGVADGAVDNWEQLERLTDHQVTDYYHATERLYRLAEVMPLSKAKRSQWVGEQKDTLLDAPDGARLVVQRVRQSAEGVRTAKRRKVARAQVVYLENQQHRMNYNEMRQQGLPIGSGTVEAGCKTLIKHRLGGSGMRWLNVHADDMLAVRALKLTPGRYEQYWEKRMRYMD